LYSASLIIDGGEKMMLLSWARARLYKKFPIENNNHAEITNSKFNLNQLLIGLKLKPTIDQ